MSDQGVMGALRPRERLRAYGEEALCERQLVALVLRSGQAGTPAEKVAAHVLERFGGAGGLVRAGLAELCEVPGVGSAGASALKAALALGRRAALEQRPLGVAFTGAPAVARYFAPQFAGLETETFHALLLDVRHRLLRDVRVATGTVSTCPVRVAEAFVAAVREAARAVIFVHNHPSGDPTPSAEDRALTTRLVDAGRLLGIDVLDHVVVCADGGFASLAERGAT